MPLSTSAGDMSDSLYFLYIKQVLGISASSHTAVGCALNVFTLFQRFQQSKVLEGMSCCSGFLCLLCHGQPSLPVAVTAYDTSSKNLIWPRIASEAVQRTAHPKEPTCLKRYQSTLVAYLAEP